MYARLTAWLAGKAWLLALCALCAGSLWLNVHQWQKAIEAPLKIRLDAKDQALEVAAVLNAESAKRELGLIAAADQVTGALRVAGNAYANAMLTKPLNPNCAPGKPRLDAVNRGLGAATPE